MQPDSPRHHEARQWLLHSAEDLRAARHDLDATPPLAGDALFHCQQAVEKALKAFLAWHDQAFRRTHDLVDIGKQCVELDGTLEPILARAAPLTDYAWKFRYPGEPQEPTQDEVQDGLSLALAVSEAIRERLPGEVLP